MPALVSSTHQRAEGAHQHLQTLSITRLNGDQCNSQQHRREGIAQFRRAFRSAARLGEAKKPEDGQAIRRSIFSSSSGQRS